MSLGACLKKSCLSLFIAGLVLVSVNISGAQVLPLIPGVANLELGSVKVVPFVKVGYEQIGINMNLPVSSLALAWILERKSLDFKLQDAGVWVGEVGLDTMTSRGLLFSLSALGSAQKNVSVKMPENPFGNFGLPQLTVNPLNWNGSQFQYWSIDGNIGWKIWSDVGIIGGVRFDKVSTDLRDPVDQFGELITQPTNQFFADFSTNVWMPYLGIKLLESNYNFTLIATPLATLSVNVPLTFILPDAGITSRETSTYNIAKPGWFIEGKFNYFLNLNNDLGFSLWGKLNWLNVKGNGTLDHVHYGPSNGGIDFDSVSGDATYSRYLVGGGVAATLSF